MEPCEWGSGVEDVDEGLSFFYKGLDAVSVALGSGEIVEEEFYVLRVAWRVFLFFQMFDLLFFRSVGGSVVER